MSSHTPLQHLVLALPATHAQSSSPHQSYAAWVPDEKTVDGLALLGGGTTKLKLRNHASWWRIFKAVVLGGTVFLAGIAAGLEVISRDHRHASLLEDSVDSSLITISPTFWGLLRLSQEDDADREAARGTGLEWNEAVAKFDPFRTLSRERIKRLEKEMTAFLKHVAKAWRDPSMGPSEVQTKPKILWRALHHIKHHHEVPYTGVQAVDQIGRAVVSSLRREGRAAAGGHSSWGRWARSWSAYSRYATFAGEKADETEARKAGLGERLRIDEWGSLMLGMEKYFQDDLHPKSLPGGYLWANMILQQIKMAVEEDESE
ncbi:hypothetical protein P7C70_g2097, partial [Phenoliferia sp. Uapishka_3]